MGEVQVKMVPVTPQKNVRLKVEQMKAHVRPVMEFAALVSLKNRIFFTEFHGIIFFFFQLLQDAEQRLPKIAPISNPLELKVEHVG